MDFVSIDFETATSVYSSVCSMGICVVKNNEVVEKKEILIKPTPFIFNDYNIFIHKIKPQMVQDKPTFLEYWDEIKPYLEGSLVVAHNASFDVGALRATLDLYNLEYPTFDYICTVKLSQKAYPELSSHKLNNLCNSLGIDFSHHQAAEDAYACANVLINIMKDYKLNSLLDIEKEFEIGIGKLYPNCYIPCSKNKKKKKAANKKVVVNH